MHYNSIAVEQLEPWAKLNDSQLNGIKIESTITTQDGTNKGGGLLSTADHNSEDVLLSVSSDLVLTKEQVFLQAKSDRHLRELLDALGDFVETPRKVIIVFLLLQMTVANSGLTHRSIGMRSAFTDYFQSLPKNISLPTFFTSEERDLLTGTSLAGAVEQKTSSLEKEFEQLKSKTEHIGWCRQAWWDEQTGNLTPKDWWLLDAIYRSRALDLPKSIGDAMVPLLDMANHAPDDLCNARFEVDPNGRVLLITREGRSIKAGEEITINYGPGGACESIFSYGFLEEQARSAREMFLSLSIPEDDPLRLAKVHCLKDAPGVRIYLNESGQTCWDSDLAWWACVNEEDGLDFELAQTTDGARELQALWKGRMFNSDNFKGIVMSDPLADIFSLRTTVMIQDRVEKQGEELSMSQDYFEQMHIDAPADRKYIYDTISRLRELELDLLKAAYGTLESEKRRLLESRTVTEYLSREGAGASTPEKHENHASGDEDFS